MTHDGTTVTILSSCLLHCPCVYKHNCNCTVNITTEIVNTTESTVEDYIIPRKKIMSKATIACVGLLVLMVLCSTVCVTAAQRGFIPRGGERVHMAQWHLVGRM